MAIKPEGVGEGKALMARPLREELFLSIILKFWKLHYTFLLSTFKTI